MSRAQHAMRVSGQIVIFLLWLLFFLWTSALLVYAAAWWWLTFLAVLALGLLPLRVPALRRPRATIALHIIALLRRRHLRLLVWIDADG